MRTLKDDVLGGRVDRNDAAVVVQVCRALLVAQIAELRERIEGE